MSCALPPGCLRISANILPVFRVQVAISAPRGRVAWKPIPASGHLFVEMFADGLCRYAVLVLFSMVFCSDLIKAYVIPPNRMIASWLPTNIAMLRIESPGSPP